MYSILDIDLDYYNLMPNAPQRLARLLEWADCSVSTVVDRHNKSFAYWRRACQKTRAEVTHILHVDEHHDMMDERKQPNIANFMVHAMQCWQSCRVFWLVQEAIDSPAMWLGEDTWRLLRPRFSHGAKRPVCWPKPDIVSVCTSPEFVSQELAAELMPVVARFQV
jgi:hypothetical protein